MQESRAKKALIIKFSSLGDVVQCLSVPTRLKELIHDGEIHWVTRSEFIPLIASHPSVNKTWSIARGSGIRALLALALQLRRENFTHVYDAHNNTRSHIISWILRWPRWTLDTPSFLRKSQKRFLRFLLFQLRINLYEQPFNGQRDLLEPLQQWGLSNVNPAPPQLLLPEFALNDFQKIRSKLGITNNYICLAPSSAHLLKRWPQEYWVQLIELAKDQKFVILGGPDDSFTKEISDKFSDRVINSAGQFSLMQSACCIYFSRGLIANDTGVLHIAEQLGVKAIALMGPAPFGFPSARKTKILERALKCRPCSKHGNRACKNSIHQECLRSISPSEVAQNLRDWILNPNA